MKKLIDHGFETSDKLGYADAYVINTCSVTSEADKKSRQAVARVLKYNPDALVYVMGCSSQNNFMQFAGKPNVRLISGVASKVTLVENIIIRGISPLNEPPALVAPLPSKYEEEVFSLPLKTRGLLKVQDGCNNFCSYCIIPYLRGRSRSRSLDKIMQEAKELSQTTKEIGITGINISAYGSDIGLRLTDLVRELGKVDVRKRLGSLECEVIDEELLSAMRDSGFCDHFHLSMQSGSDAVLKAMNRRYDSAYYLRKVDLIRKYFPNAGIMTDIICGFPTETEQNHIESMQTVKKAAFADAHVFPYSKRIGTPAAKLPQLPGAVKRVRAAEMSDLAAKLSENFRRSQKDKVYPVYIEEKEGEYYVGYTPNYIKTYAKKVGEKEIVNLRIGEIYKEGVTANE